MGNKRDAFASSVFGREVEGAVASAWSSPQGHGGDAWASSDGGRGRLRNARGSCQTSIDPVMSAGDPGN